jgi:glycosyltransferase involved in cell wall biosynthesis
MDARLVSVIIPNYNYARFLDQAIQSVLSQTYEGLELIVVNNGSTDDSLEVLEKYGNSITVVDQENLGQSGARNSGIAKARGELIAFLDADDFWDPTKIELQMKLISPVSQLVYCGITSFQDTDLLSGQIESPKYSGDCSSYFIDYPGDSIVLSGESSALFTRDLLEKVGEFDNELNSTAGWDFFRRCSKNTMFDYVSKPLAYHRLHSSNMSNSSEKVIQDMRRAYSKLLRDSQWVIPAKKERELLRSLEWSYLKTFLKEGNLQSAINSASNLMTLTSKSF